MIFQEGGTTYKNFLACYEGELKHKMRMEPAKYADLQNFLDYGGLELLQFLEKNFNCASMCRVPIFYMTKDIDTPSPTEECLKPFVETL